MYNKTIILSSENSEARGILTLSNEISIKGKLRLYNLNALPDGSKLGIFVGGNVYYSNSKKDYDCYTFDFNENFNIKDDLYCAIIKLNNDKKEVILQGGSYECYFQEEDNPPSTDKCESCPYKEYFYSSALENINNESTTNDKQKDLKNDDVQTIQTTSLEENTTKSNDDNFYQTIKNEFDELFDTYPLDDTINNLIPNSKFVKIKGEKNTQYSLGVIYEENDLKYIVYGVPSKYNEEAPVEFEQDYQWLPLNADDPMSDGYLLVFQNALDGKIVKMTIQTAN